MTHVRSWTALAALLSILGTGVPTASAQQPVNGWYWRPDLEEPLSVIAKGLGTSARQAGAGIAATAAYADGGWTLVVSRPLGSNRPGSALLALGATTKVAFAVWQGANRERGGAFAAVARWPLSRVMGPPGRGTARRGGRRGSLRRGGPRR